MSAHDDVKAGRRGDADRKRTYVIGEAGVNHNGELRKALALCAIAKQAGCDAVKFQTFKAESVVTASADKAEYQQRTTGDSSQLEMIRALELPWQDFVTISAECERIGITFLSTAFDAESLTRLDALGVPLHKVASGEITNLPFLRAVARCGKPVILSTGMATLDEIEFALGVLRDGGIEQQSVTVLHCNTDYPTPMSDVNLRAMETIRERFGVPVGYSDHTVGIEVAIAAAALGARVIEKHFTMDRLLPGPDHAASLEPPELAAMVTAIRNIDLALGDGVKAPSPSERKNIPIARRSIVASRPIAKGERFTEENITAKRPGTGISPARWDEVIGKTARKDFGADDLVEL